jgi:glycerophosphoryl diester phosphodiesterase
VQLLVLSFVSLVNCCLNALRVDLLNAGKRYYPGQTKAKKKHWLLDAEQTVLVGHRGCIVPANPSGNTMSAFKRALAGGLQGVEVDLQLTKDGEVVVFHDQFLHPLLNEPDPAKLVADCTLADMKSLTFAAEADKAETVSTLREVLEFCQNARLKVLLECKEMRDTHLCCAKVADMLVEMGMVEDVAFISFDPFALLLMRQQVCTPHTLSSRKHAPRARHGP